MFQMYYTIFLCTIEYSIHYWAVVRSENPGRGTVVPNNSDRIKKFNFSGYEIPRTYAPKNSKRFFFRPIRNSVSSDLAAENKLETDHMYQICIT